MEIIAKRFYFTPSGTQFDTGIKTSFEPAEIIALRADGTSQSTNPVAHAARESGAALKVVSEYLRGRAELEPEVSRLTAERDQALKNCQKLAKKAFGIEGHEKEIERLESELKAANDELQKLSLERAPTLKAGPYSWVTSADYLQMRKERDAAGSLARATIAERDQLKRQLENVTTETTHGTIRPDDVVTFRADWDIPEHNGKPFATMVENGELVKILRADRDKIAGRLSKCREEKRELKERLRGEVLRLETLRDVRQALGCTFGDVVATARKVVAQKENLITEIDQIGSVLKPSPNHDVLSKARELVSKLSHAKAELQRRAKCMEDCGLALGMDKDAAQYSGYVEKRALYVMSELERLKTTYSMDRVHGMPLDEVRGLKAERDGLKSTEASRLRQLEYARQGRDEAQEKLRKTGFILGADMRLSGCVTQAAANIVEDLTRTKRRLETSLQGECDLRNMVHGLTAKLVAVTRALSG